MATLEEQIIELRKELRDVREERNMWHAAAKHDKDAANSWAISKVERQRKALDLLCRRVTTQRFYLRIANELGHLPSRDEFVAARDALAVSEEHRSRLDTDLLPA